MERYRLQTTPGVLILLVRHGLTALNDPSNPQVRGWKDEPLSAEGKSKLVDTVKQLEPYDPQYVFHSDFMRDSETAHILANALGIPVQSDFDARTWDVGSYSGKPEAEVNSRIAELYKRPWMVPPGSSESFNDFSKRWVNFLDRKMEFAEIPAMRPIIIVTHGRNIALTQSYLLSINPLECSMPYPGGLSVISVKVNGVLDFEIISPSEPVISDI